MYIDEIEPDLCMLCFKPFKHYKRYKCAGKVDDKHYIKEVDFILNCARCRDTINKLTEINNKLEEIRQERTDREWKQFRLRSG